MSANPMSWLSSVMRIALQRPSMPVIRAVTPGSANQVASEAAASESSVHGQMSTIVDGDAISTPAIANCTSPAAIRVERTRRSR
jgi:hypothetical protein